MGSAPPRGVTPINWKPSPSSTPRRYARSLEPPIQIGTRCAGCGSTRRSSNPKNSPWNDAGSCSHTAQHRDHFVHAPAAVLERPAERVELGLRPPDPAATITRPPLNASRLASAFANQSGLCCGSTSTLVPSPTFGAAAAAHVSVSSGS